jgi:hypothetical protein
LQPSLAYITNSGYRHIVTIASADPNGSAERHLFGRMTDVASAGCRLFPVEP